MDKQTLEQTFFLKSVDFFSTTRQTVWQKTRIVAKLKTIWEDLTRFPESEKDSKT